MKSIKAEIVADSRSTGGVRITSYLLTYPRFIHAELMTHRVFSRNSASSRAIPLNKMIEMVQKDPFIPIAWQRDHKGMQGTEYLDDKYTAFCEMEWKDAANEATLYARGLNDLYGVTKQLCNRILEPFMWHTTLVTATEWDNFFELRCPAYRPASKQEDVSCTAVYKSKKDAIKDYPNETYECDVNDSWRNINESEAEIHIQALAESMWDAMNESTPKSLHSGEWHIPFGDKFKGIMAGFPPHDHFYEETMQRSVKVATARCARLSYNTFDGEIDFEKDIKLHDRLLESKHFSPFEHCAKAMTTEEYAIFYKGEFFVDPKTGALGTLASNHGWCDNFKGYVSYRYIMQKDTENLKNK